MAQVMTTDETKLVRTDNEMIFTRLFDAPQEMVFNAWTRPEHVAQWWGPRGFTTDIHSMDVKTGGESVLTMHGPDGAEYPNKMVYLEVIRTEKLVYKVSGVKKGGLGIHFVTTVTFEAAGAQTVVTMRQRFESKEDVEKVVREFGADEGGKQVMTWLAEHLATMAAEKEFVLVREFDASKELVYRMWTEAELLLHWWAPRGFKVKIYKLDAKPGGIFHYSMTSPANSPFGEKVFWGRFVYRETAAPDRLVFMNSISDEQGGIGRHPLMDTWPLEILMAVTFVENRGKTTMTLRGVPWHATAEEQATFAVQQEQMRGGFGTSFDKMDEYLATTTK